LPNYVQYELGSEHNETVWSNQVQTIVALEGRAFHVVSRAVIFINNLSYLPTANKYNAKVASTGG